MTKLVPGWTMSFTMGPLPIEVNAIIWNVSLVDASIMSEHHLVRGTE